MENATEYRFYVWELDDQEEIASIPSPNRYVAMNAEDFDGLPSNSVVCGVGPTPKQAIAALCEVE